MVCNAVLTGEVLTLLFTYIRYFYNPNDLEEDLLLMCLKDGHGKQDEFAHIDGRGTVSYEDENAKTGLWITQQLWSRTAWRIVHGKKGAVRAFVRHASAD